MAVFGKREGFSANTIKSRWIYAKFPKKWNEKFQNLIPHSLGFHQFLYDSTHQVVNACTGFHLTKDETNSAQKSTTKTKMQISTKQSCTKAYALSCGLACKCVTDVSLVLLMNYLLPNKDALQLSWTNRTGSTTGCRLYDNNRRKVCRCATIKTVGVNHHNTIHLFWPNSQNLHITLLCSRHSED
jgi:hypothetical protein